jgi:hypothetical protein
MTRCSLCNTETENAPEPRFYNLADPTEPTMQAICDACREPRPVPADYAAPFADGDEEGKE